ncbi:MAG: FAD-binding protein, partial [Acidobacteriota bacterium]
MRALAPPLRDGVRVSPGSVEEVCRLVARAHERGWLVEPQGGGTRPALATREAQPELVLVTQRLNRIRHHEPADMVAS